MSTIAEPMSDPFVQVRSRLADYRELTKPRIATMALVTVAVGYFLGSEPSVHWNLFLATLLGAGLVAAGGSALNHWLERHADAKMNRTVNRPLPSARLGVWEVLLFGVTLYIVGVAYLAWALPSPVAAIVAALTGFMYVAIYTPSKQLTTWNTLIGAIPGALPPVIGWAAADGSLSPNVWVLFAILFVWQLPHFYSIAWLYRDDYARGGMVMLPVVDRTDGKLTGWTTALTCGVLVIITAMPTVIGVASWIYLIGAMPIAVWFLARCVRFAQHRTDRAARTVLRGSLVYLLAVMGLLVVDGILPRYMG